MFKEAKVMLKDLMDREKDNLGSYVVNESLKIAGKGFPLEVSRFGNKEELESLSLEDIRNTYASMIEDDSLQIMVVGDVIEDNVKRIFKTFFKHHPHYVFENHYLVTNNTEELVVIERAIPSPYFSVVYNTHTSNKGREYWALQLMSMVLGQLPNSFLFQEVREKRSLCYFIRSMVLGYDGVMVVTSGVRDQSEDEAIELVQVQIDRIIKGEVSDELFDSAKVMMSNSIYQTDDANRRIVDSEYRKIILDEDLNTQDLLDLINDIKKEELVDVAERLELNTTYKMVKGA